MSAPQPQSNTSTHDGNANGRKEEHQNEQTHTQRPANIITQSNAHNHAQQQQSATRFITLEPPNPPLSPTPYRREGDVERRKRQMHENKKRRSLNSALSGASAGVQSSAAGDANNVSGQEMDMIVEESSVSTSQTHTTYTLTSAAETTGSQQDLMEDVHGLQQRPQLQQTQSSEDMKISPNDQARQLPPSAFRMVRSASDLRPNLKREGRLAPLHLLTLHLLHTYSKISPSTFTYTTTSNPRRVLTKPSVPTHNNGHDNQDYDYICYVGDILGSREGAQYQIVDVFGQGTFGQVVKCFNVKSKEYVAVKVIKNKPAYYNQSLVEVAILDMLNTQYDPSDKFHICRMVDTFVFRNHLCIVQEMLSVNLYELIKQNHFRGLSTNLVRVFVSQILDALVVLHRAKIIHCDLKPENILLKSLESPTIKVIDFGSACHENQTVYTYIQSRFYRSPEVLLGLPYTSSIDMWSLGCIAAELFLGLPLFPGSSEYNQVSRIVEMLGVPPNYMIEKGKNAKNFFKREDGTWHLLSMDEYVQQHPNAKEAPSKRYFTGTSLPEIITNYPITRKGLSPREMERELLNRQSFIDFLSGLLKLNPLERWSPMQAKQHPFVTGEKWTGPFKPNRVVPIVSPGVKRKPQTATNVNTNMDASYEEVQHFDGGQVVDMSTIEPTTPSNENIHNMYNNAIPQTVTSFNNATTQEPTPSTDTDDDGSGYKPRMGRPRANTISSTSIFAPPPQLQRLVGAMVANNHSSPPGHSRTPRNANSNKNDTSPPSTSRRMSVSKSRRMGVDSDATKSAYIGHQQQPSPHFTPPITRTISEGLETRFANLGMDYTERQTPKNNGMPRMAGSASSEFLAPGQHSHIPIHGYSMLASKSASSSRNNSVSDLYSPNGGSTHSLLDGYSHPRRGQTGERSHVPSRVPSALETEFELFDDRELGLGMSAGGGYGSGTPSSMNAALRGSNYGSNTSMTGMSMGFAMGMMDVLGAGPRRASMSQAYHSTPSSMSANMPGIGLNHPNLSSATSNSANTDAMINDATSAAFQAAAAIMASQIGSLTHPQLMQYGRRASAPTIPAYGTNQLGMNMSMNVPSDTSSSGNGRPTAYGAMPESSKHMDQDMNGMEEYNIYKGVSAPLETSNSPRNRRRQLQTQQQTPQLMFTQGQHSFTPPQSHNHTTYSPSSPHAQFQYNMMMPMNAAQPGLRRHSIAAGPNTMNKSSSSSSLSLASTNSVSSSSSAASSRRGSYSFGHPSSGVGNGTNGCNAGEIDPSILQALQQQQQQMQLQQFQQQMFSTPPMQRAMSTGTSPLVSDSPHQAHTSVMIPQYEGAGQQSQQQQIGNMAGYRRGSMQQELLAQYMSTMMQMALAQSTSDPSHTQHHPQHHDQQHYEQQQQQVQMNNSQIQVHIPEQHQEERKDGSNPSQA